MPRASEVDVRGVMDADDDLNVVVFIRMANRFLNALMQTCTALASLDEEHLADIETLLAAHYAHPKDPTYRSKATGGASGTFQGISGKYLEGTDHGQRAIELDTSGCLAKYQAEMMQSKGNTAGLSWLGKRNESESVDYEDRD